MKFKYALTIVCLFAVFTFTRAYAQDIWLGGAGNWSTAANWSTGIVPNGSTIDVRIDNGNPAVSVVTFDLAIGSVGDLILDSDDTLTVQGALTSYFATLNSGTLFVQNSGTLNNSGLLNNYSSGSINLGLYGSVGALNSNGSLNNYGGINIGTSGALNNNGLLNNYGGVVGVGDIIKNFSGGQINNYGLIGFQSGLLANAGLLNNYGRIIVFDLAGMTNAGTIYNSGTMFSEDYFYNNGTIYNSGDMGPNGPAIFDNGGTIYNTGTIGVSGIAVFGNTGSLYNYGTFGGTGSTGNGGVFNNYGQLINSGNGFGNTGTLNNYAASYMGNTGPVLNTGAIMIASGAVMAFNVGLYGSGTFTQSAGSMVVDGLLSSQSAPIQINGGTMSGSGVIQGDVMMGGTMSPGDSPGKLTIQGNYTQLSTGTFFAELAGLAPGTQYDQLAVSGTATLDGTLDVMLLNGFAVHLGNSFVLMTFGDEVGQFGTLDLPTLPGYEQWLLSYNANDLLLSVEAKPTPEPASFLLLGSALLGALGLFRRPTAKRDRRHCSVRLLSS